MIPNALLSYDLDFTRVVNATAAGATDVNGTVLDMDGWDGVIYVGMFGTLTATQVTKLQGQSGALANGSDQADISGAITAGMADGDSNKMLVLDVARNSARYQRVVVKRATANAVIDGVVAIRYRARVTPKTQGSTVSQIKQFLSA